MGLTCMQDLGLGVLEERDPNAGSASESDDDDPTHPKEKDVLGKLMGQARTKERGAIEEVSGEKGT